MDHARFISSSSNWNTASTPTPNVLASRNARSSDGHLHPHACPLREPGRFPNHDLPEEFFSDLGKLLGMQDIEVGDPDFDEAFIIKGNDESKVCGLFADPKIRQMIQAQPKVRLEVKDSEGWFGPKFPEDVDELFFQVVGVIKDVERLKARFDLLAAVLDQLCQIGSAYKLEPGVTL